MKQRSTTPSVSKQFATKSALVAAAVLMTIATPIQMSQLVKADSYDDQIRSIQSKVNEYNSQAARLSGEADSLQNEIARLTAEKNAIQAKMDLNQAEYNRLNDEIAKNEKKLAQSKDALGTILANLYVDDKISPLEMIASSKNIGDFLDKQEYRNSVRDSLATTISQIKTLRKKLQSDKAAVEQVLEEQKVQRDLLAGKEAEQQKLLDKTRGDEAQYRELVAKGESAMATVRAQQAQAQAALRGSSGFSGGAGNSGGYPWAGSPTNYNDNCRYPNGGSGADDWGYCVRQCTSYVAWKLARDGKNPASFSGMGHAYSWYYSGTPVSAGDVRRGDVIVWIGGPYGHVMYVEGASGGSVSFTDYNGAGGAVSPGQGSMSAGAATSGPYRVIRF